MRFSSNDYSQLDVSVLFCNCTIYTLAIEIIKVLLVGFFFNQFDEVQCSSLPLGLVNNSNLGWPKTAINRFIFCQTDS